MPSIARDVFDIIAQRLAASATLPSLLDGGFSFENWITAEAYAAFAETKYDFEAMPSYPKRSGPSQSGARKWAKGDLWVWIKKENESAPPTPEIMVEIKTVGVGTYKKYYAEIAADRDKLCGYVDESDNHQAEGLQLVLAYADEKNYSRLEENLSWLEIAANPRPTLVGSRENFTRQLSWGRQRDKGYITRLLGWHVARIA